LRLATTSSRGERSEEGEPETFATLCRLAPRMSGTAGCGLRPMHSNPARHHLAESTVALARKASSGCNIMVYTTHVHAAGNRNVSAQTLVRQLLARAPPRNGSTFAPRCQTALLSPTLAELLRAENLTDEAAFPWDIVPLQITGQNSGDARIVSKIAKMAPFLLFPQAGAVVFFDFKLALKLPAEDLVAHALATPGRGGVVPTPRGRVHFAAMQHPCVTDTHIPPRGRLFAPTWCRSHSRDYGHGWSARAWMIHEAIMIAAAGKTRNATRLQAAVEQYARHVPDTSHLCKPSPPPPPPLSRVLCLLAWRTSSMCGANGAALLPAQIWMAVF
jgi:hypothetical protein